MTTTAGSLPAIPVVPADRRVAVRSLQRAAQEAITPEHVGALIRVALRHGLQGNLAAIRLVLERVCGRAPEAEAEGAALDVALPALRTGAACAAAVDKIAAAVTAGTIDNGKAKLLIDVVPARMKSIEVSDLEQRLAELEKQASTVDFGGAALSRPASSRYSTSDPECSTSVSSPLFKYDRRLKALTMPVGHRLLLHDTLEYASSVVPTLRDKGLRPVLIELPHSLGRPEVRSISTEYGPGAKVRWAIVTLPSTELDAGTQACLSAGMLVDSELGALTRWPASEPRSQCPACGAAFDAAPGRCPDCGLRFVARRSSKDGDRVQ